MASRYPILQGDLVQLAPLSRDDLPLYVRWFSNLEFTAYLGQTGFAPTEQDESEWLDRTLKHSATQVTFGIVVRETDTLVGNVSLMEIDQKHGTATLGIAIGEPAVYGLGYGTEATRLMVEYGCYFLNLWSIRLWYVDFNRRGERAYQKAGFREVGRLRETFLLGDQRYDQVLMDIVRSEVDLSRMRQMVSLLTEPDR